MSEFRIQRLGNCISGEIEREGFPLNRQGVSDWLREKNVPVPDCRVLEFRDIEPWGRTGAETYSAVFEINTDISRRLIIVKALVTLIPEKSLCDWVRRRSYLLQHAIPVANWYSASRATIYEDFYPGKAIDHVAFTALLRIGYKLDMLGFTTLKFIDDIRSDEDGNPFYTDFGFDLGEPSSNPTLEAQTMLITKFPGKAEKILRFYKEQT